MKALLIPFLIIALLSSCGKSANKPNFEGSENEIAFSSPAVMPADEIKGSHDKMDNDISNQSIASQSGYAGTDDIQRKIIKEGEIVFKSNNINNTRRAIISAVKNLGGYVSEETESGYENHRKNYTIKLRVPAKNFDAMLESVSAEAAQIDSKNIRTQDITTEYIDTETRLKNKKILEQRYFELLKKAVKVDDILSIENKLEEIRSEIESVEGQLRYMSKQVVYSSLVLTFYSESTVPETGKGFFYELKNSIITGWNFVRNLFFGFIAVWPLLLIISISIWWYRQRKNRKNSA